MYLPEPDEGREEAANTPQEDEEIEVFDRNNISNGSGQSLIGGEMQSSSHCLEGRQVFLTRC
jgi:hypothetical protein